MQLRKFRWSKVYESSEEELQQALKPFGGDPTRWVAEAGDEFEAQSQPRNTTLWCAEGSLIFRAEDTKISLQPGDALAIPAKLSYEIHAGISGCVCYQTYS